jgi:hypothetical protein
MVEAFSLRGLGRLAESWKQNPPFPDENVSLVGSELRRCQITAFCAAPQQSA